MAYNSIAPFCVAIWDVGNLVVSIDEWEFLPAVLGLLCEMFASSRGQAVHCAMDCSQSSLFKVVPNHAGRLICLETRQNRGSEQTKQILPEHRRHPQTKSRE